MNKFEVVSRFKDSEINLLPVRATEFSAGYDFVVAEDIVLEPYYIIRNKLRNVDVKEPLFLEEVALITKHQDAKPTLVSTGVKCHLDPNYYLQLSVRSSFPLKHWIILANGVGIIDADYCNNTANEGEIFFQLINLSPYSIHLKKGDKIGQGVILPYGITVDDKCLNKERTGGFGSTTGK